MKILLIGATGTIGKAIATELKDHDVLAVGNSSGDYQVDLNDNVSIEALFDKTGKVDAVISTAGSIVFAPVKDLTEAQYNEAVAGKLTNHLNLFRIAQNYITEGGSFTLTSGDLAQNPMPGGAAVSMVNGALDSFAKAAALETGKALRVNTVSPHFVKETMEMMGMDSTSGISAADTAKAYRHAVESTESGQIFDVPNYV
ncbi:short chain dehydrogenase [Nitratireductor kimnyeongensis]|uniref:Short chain dehydrogenase n=1 Tax=Nitratireductor kimnyeongensis TaxID=430679 RepID=A0ABW0T9P0_9HYPH|nr:short chain dehydrogenase [Nitratireductor kimnyeongensis]QZZ35477.1 short chain dehydrogenase [Nitratireductor kimnyeongensis]